MTITLSSCFYIIKSKFDPSIYVKWMNNFLSIVNDFNLVIYSDENTSTYINTNENPRIKIVIKPMEEFYNYKYRDCWIRNHENNYLLNENSCWELNMLWSEKIWFVKETIDKKYFDTEFYGWCDIGYFRNRPEDLHTSGISNWGKNTTVLEKNRDKICYACIQNDKIYMNRLFQIVNDKNSQGLPRNQIPPYQNSVAGGFFLLHKERIDWWATTYDTKLAVYFENGYLVKDDQIILLDCILSNVGSFTLFRENNQLFDNWFMFQRILL